MLFGVLSNFEKKLVVARVAALLVRFPTMYFLKILNRQA